MEEFLRAPDKTEEGGARGDGVFMITHAIAIDTRGAVDAAHAATVSYDSPLYFPIGLEQQKKDR